MATRSASDSETLANAEGNARLTGSLGGAIFVLLIIEGVTVPWVQRLISLHVFVGVLLISFVVAKIASTTYRFGRYYLGQREYVEKGPPALVLRLLGPVVTITTVAVLATGIGAVFATRGSHWLVLAHKASFILWFMAMTIHVLGHALETPALAFADWRRSQRSRAPGAIARTVVLAAVVAVGVPLAIASIGWADHWRRLHGH